MALRTQDMLVVEILFAQVTNIKYILIHNNIHNTTNLLSIKILGGWLLPLFEPNPSNASSPCPNHPKSLNSVSMGNLTFSQAMTLTNMASWIFHFFLHQHQYDSLNLALGIWFSVIRGSGWSHGCLSCAPWNQTLNPWTLSLLQARDRLSSELSALRFLNIVFGVILMT